MALDVKLEQGREPAERQTHRKIRKSTSSEGQFGGCRSDRGLEIGRCVFPNAWPFLDLKFEFGASKSYRGRFLESIWFASILFVRVGVKIKLRVRFDHCALNTAFAATQEKNVRFWTPDLFQNQT